LESINDKFFKFLRDDISVFKIEKEKRTYVVVKIPYGFHLDLLYSGYEYEGSFNIHKDLAFSGILDRETQNLYELAYNIRNDILGFSWENNPYSTSSQIFQEINDKIQENITNYVLDNQEEFYEAVTKEYKPYITEYDVYENFLNDEKQIVYRNGYKTDNYNILLEYLDKGDEYLIDYALTYAMKYKERIGENLVDIDIKNKYLKEIYQNENHKIHKIKNIIDSLRELDCSNVHVFVNKDGKDFDFKYDRYSLLNNYDSSYLSSYNIPSASRKSFEKLFGKYADFHYEDITKIEFRNKPIYEDLNFDYSYNSVEESVGL